MDMPSLDPLDQDTPGPSTCSGLSRPPRRPVRRLADREGISNHPNARRHTLLRSPTTLLSGLPLPLGARSP